MNSISFTGERIYFASIGRCSVAIKSERCSSNGKIALPKGSGATSQPGYERGIESAQVHSGNHFGLSAVGIWPLENGEEVEGGDYPNNLRLVAYDHPVDMITAEHGCDRADRVVGVNRNDTRIHDLAGGES